jgi:uncharacterized membrane protein YhfC
MSSLAAHPRGELGVVMPFWLDRPDEEALEIAVAAEHAGIETVWIGELVSFDAFALATAIQVWPSGSPGALLWQANIEQLRPKLTGDGLLSEHEVERFCQLVEDPDFSVNSYVLVSGWGQRATP